MENDGLAGMCGKVRLIQLRQSDVSRPGNVFARVLVGFANVDENCAVLYEAFGVLGRDGLLGSCSVSFLVDLANRPTIQPVKGGK